MKPAGSEDELRLSLMGHLAELRRRLVKVALAVLILGFLSLAFSRELFHFLVQPILQALPEGERALIQTSAIEELNTFMKVGIYAGFFFAAPVLLYQLWAFVAPGLYAHERRMALPFVAAGTTCFLAGAAFCYWVVLPPAFEFLLKPDEIRARQVELQVIRGTVDDAAFLLRMGDLAEADRLLDAAEPALAPFPAGGTDRQILLERVDRLGPVLEAAERASRGSGAGRDELAEAVRLRGEARAAAIEGRQGAARTALERSEAQAIAAVSKAFGAEGKAAAELASRHTEAAARLASAANRLALDDWTRPMLSMREQLQLVLILLIAFGLIFEIPVVFALLGALGVIDGSELAKFRRYAIVANVILAAVITPTGDPFNLALMAVPMILCYEIGILAARATSRRRKAREEAALAA